MNSIQTVGELISEIGHQCITNATPGRTQPRRIIVSETINDVIKKKNLTGNSSSNGQTLNLEADIDGPGPVYIGDLLTMLKSHASTLNVTINDKNIVSVSSTCEFWDEICT